LYLAYAVVILVGWGAYLSGQSCEKRFLDYRMLAEALRVQFFWRLAGISEPLRDGYPERRWPEVG
jgi:hypothetical protein